MHLVAIDLAGQDPELVADRCWQAGATGLWQPTERTLRAGVPDDRVEAFVAAVADLGPTDVTETESVELAGRQSEVSVADHRIELWVPATVFGDGHHPTTASCLEILPAVVSPASRVLDVGCGAGALAVSAALLGGTVTAIDTDVDAVEATRANAARNGVPLIASTTPLAAMDGPYDLVLANLTVGALEPLVSDLVRTTVAGGTMVLSGMLETQWPRIREAAGGTAGPVRTVDGWVTAVVTAD